MPPRKGIVKSGNAGNSSKSKGFVPSSSTAPGLDTPPPLFPPGSKYPLSLLNERLVALPSQQVLNILTTHLEVGHPFTTFISRIFNASETPVDAKRKDGRDL
jgi:ATP-dependent RNA helicase DHX57